MIRLSKTRLPTILRIDALAEIVEVGERLFAALTSTMCSTAASPTPLIAASE